MNGVPVSSAGTNKHGTVSLPSCLHVGGVAAPTNIGAVAMPSSSTPAAVSRKPSHAPRGGLGPIPRSRRKATRGNAKNGIDAPHLVAGRTALLRPEAPRSYVLQPCLPPQWHQCEQPLT